MFSIICFSLLFWLLGINTEIIYGLTTCLIIIINWNSVNDSKSEYKYNPNVEKINEYLFDNENETIRVFANEKYEGASANIDW